MAWKKVRVKKLRAFVVPYHHSHRHAHSIWWLGGVGWPWFAGCLRRQSVDCITLPLQNLLIANCPGPLNNEKIIVSNNQSCCRWSCHRNQNWKIWGQRRLKKWKTKGRQQSDPETCDLWDIWSKWLGDMKKYNDKDKYKDNDKDKDI